MHISKLIYGHRIYKPYLKTVCKRHVYNSTSIFSKNLTDPENIGTYQPGVNFDTLGTWKHKLDLPVHVEHSVKKGKLIPRIEIKHVGTATLKGRRRENEDRILLHNITKNLLVFGLFDGHGSPLAADFMRMFVEDAVVYWIRHGVEKLEIILQKIILELNNMMSRHMYYYCPDELRNSGTTATIALLRNSVDLVVGHVGDSRAILCRSGIAEELSHDHEPGIADEQSRIRRRGGVVSTNSLGVPVVNGRLGMTRSIGDAELKAYGVVPYPYIQYRQVRHGRDAFLVMVTDGVTFVMSSQEVVELISSCHTPQEAANMVTDQALQFGSEDNATAIIIPFGSWGKYAKSGKPNRYSFGRNLLGTRFYG